MTSVLYPDISISPDDIYIVTKPGDRLDVLAYIYYESPQHAWILAEANKLGKGSYTVPAGIQLRIPSDIEDFLQEYEELNSIDIT
jgi:phage tail protein X